MASIIPTDARGERMATATNIKKRYETKTTTRREDGALGSR
jgi:hypothetical protein